MSLHIGLLGDIGYLYFKPNFLSYCSILSGIEALIVWCWFIHSSVNGRDWVLTALFIWGGGFSIFLSFKLLVMLGKGCGDRVCSSAHSATEGSDWRK